MLLDHKVIVGLAVLGAVVSTAGGYLLRQKSTINRNVARFILRAGYAISWASVAVFIAKGFHSGW